MSNLEYRHWHSCPQCTQTWECFAPGGCREDKEKTCVYDSGEGDEDDTDEEVE